MITRLAVSSAYSITSPTSAQNLIARSSDASDTMNLSIVGATAGPVAVSETRALTGKREVSFATNSLITLTGLNLASVAAGTVTVRQQGTKGTAPLIVTTNPSNNDTVTIGLVGFTQAYRFRTVLATAYDVLIGAAIADTAENLRRAIFDGSVTRGDGTGEGTLYGTSTAAHLYLEPSAISGQIITLRDLLACSRQLAWSFAQSGTGLSIPSTLSGGVDGTLLGTLAAGVTQAYSSFTLWTPDVVATTLPALATPTTNAVNLRGKPFTLHIRCANISSSVAMRMETSDDGTNWASRAATYPIASADNSEQFVSVTEPVEYARVVVTANANTTDSALHIAMISQ